jgi:hypothetical protein
MVTRTAWAVRATKANAGTPAFAFVFLVSGVLRFDLVNEILIVPKRNIAKQQVFCCVAAMALRSRWDILRP